MEDMLTYDARAVSIIVDSINLFGFGDGDMVTCSKDANNAEIKVDAQGQASAAINNDNLGTIKIELAQTSPCYPKMMAIANEKKIVPVRVVNGTEVIGGSKAIIEKLPDAGFGKSVGARSFSFKVLDYKHTVD
ncbi:phage structural protein [Carnobacterium maltaromaticum]|jgi:hypothetical protein|uniref:Gp15 n=2 Tax=Carnobacterium maltaromaticum TaxID=2751 RepID=K8E4F0_CARML|nr:hypothetical protein [Carnobacterium maltaromaticum]AOA01486.1 hypothetical protein BFC23_02690 [Carnobacterium maltaromaticum]KRN62443.1 hypothetical protein IV70_GL003559 [Carnobacterium maltaromaticum DSM 20342]KRN72361.1 hypothetical protein IV76_GL002587 [Carnobacterium maltaromaticum]MBC9789536.1 hypothetical protein [Carnobacterium maltaromaticum]MDZ5758053.1 hypothetical protein [Carnobacterium maltaromaticum]